MVEKIDRELARLRREQAKLVMPLIGPLLDAFEGIPNDLLSLLEDQAEEFVVSLQAIEEAMESAE